MVMVVFELQLRQPTTSTLGDNRHEIAKARSNTMPVDLRKAASMDKISSGLVTEVAISQ
jgi:hypothetical protein